MIRVRKRPVVVEAWRWNKIGDHPRVVLRDNVLGAEPMVHTISGWVVVKPGDWIIRGVEGEYYPCSDSVFEATYERIDSPEDGQKEGRPKAA